MNCSKCSSKMTLLFTSYVCDTCDPPKNNNVLNKNTSAVGNDGPPWYGYMVLTNFKKGSGGELPYLFKDLEYAKSLANRIVPYVVQVRSFRKNKPVYRDDNHAIIGYKYSYGEEYSSVDETVNEQFHFVSLEYTFSGPPEKQTKTA